MNREEYLKELNKAFGDFKFFPEDHHYEYKGQRIGISVTKFIEQYTNEFDADTIAQKVAIKEGKSVQEVLNEWKAKNDWACEKGSMCHEYIQSIWEGNIAFGYESNEIIEKIFNQADKFFVDYRKRLEHLADEFVIGSVEYNVASAVDHLFVDKTTGGLVLVDYKTNSDMRKNERYAKQMKPPLEHLKDTTLNHYTIQISIYKYLIEKYAGVKVSKWFIVYMSENIDNYEIIEVPYLKDEVEKILEWRLLD